MKRTFFLSVITVLGISMLCSCQNTSNSLSEMTIDKITELEDSHNISILYDGKEVKDELTLDYTLAKDVDEIAEAVEAADVIFGRLQEDWAMTIANPDMELEGIRKIENVSVIFCEDLKNEKDAE